MIKLTLYQQDLANTLRNRRTNTTAHYVGIICIAFLASGYMETYLGNPPPGAFFGVLEFFTRAYIVFNFSFLAVQFTTYWLYVVSRSGLRHLKNTCALPMSHKTRKDTVQKVLEILHATDKAVLNVYRPSIRTVMDFIVDWRLVVALYLCHYTTTSFLLGVSIFMQYVMVHKLKAIVVEVISLLPDPAAESDPELELTQPAPKIEAKKSNPKDNKTPLKDEKYDINELMNRLTNGE